MVGDDEDDDDDDVFADPDADDEAARSEERYVDATKDPFRKRNEYSIAPMWRGPRCFLCRNISVVVWAIGQ